MVIVFYNKLDETKGAVTLIHHQPQLLSDTEKIGGISFQEFPMSENRPGFYALPYIDLVAMQPYYEYVEKPLTKEEQMQKEIDDLKAQLAALQA